MNKYFFSSLLLSLSLVLSVFILSNTYKNRNNHKEKSIRIKGSASKNFESNLIVWNGVFSRKGRDLKSIYEALKQDQLSIENYLLEKGLKKEEIIFSSVVINKDFKSNYNKEGKFTGDTFIGYNLNQNIKIESNEINKIDKISRDISKLIQLGIEFYSNPPNYYYTNLSELKHDMLEAASKDARIRAEKIVNQANGRLGKLIEANMGTFQIIGKNSNEEYSSGGSFNTWDRFKTASITVNLHYQLK